MVNHSLQLEIKTYSAPYHWWSYSLACGSNTSKKCMITYHKTFTYPKCKWIVECKTGQKVKEKCTEDDRLVRKCKKYWRK